MSAKVTFLEPEKKAAPDAAPAPVVLVPQDAVASRGGKSVVFVVREGKAQVRAVTTGAERQGQVVIRDGLSGGETLVSRPPEKLKDGDTVRVKERG
jgi:hypothetical protein